MTTAILTRPIARQFARAKRALTLAFLNRSISTVTLDLMATRRDLEMAEEDLRYAEPWERSDLQDEVIELQWREGSLDEELGYLSAKRQMILEQDGECPGATN